MFISCRVAQKRIENAVIYCLCDYYNLENNAIVTANFVSTSKNKPILDSFILMGFTLVDNNLKADRTDIIDPRKTILVSF
jgi:predicted enzyme involved in methoxymalonyl-ACP biosynthesis